MKKSLRKFPLKINEVHLAPEINPKNGLPFHEWFIEFEDKPNNLDLFSKDLDKNLQELNSYYKDLITGKVLQPLKITKVKKGAFREYMSSIGKLGGQNKVPRLSNDRKIAEALSKYIT